MPPTPPFEIALNPFDWVAVEALSGFLLALVGFLIGRGLRKREATRRSYELLSEYRGLIIDFSKEFLGAVAEAKAAYEARGENAHDLRRASTRLSGLADTGRFIFPNDLGGEDAADTERGPAFAGRRRPALDAILAAHFAAEAMWREDGRVWRAKALHELRKTGQPLSEPVVEDDATYLLGQARRCYLNAVVPTTFPREWREMFADLLGPMDTGRT